MIHSKFALCLFVATIMPGITQADEKQAVPISRTIKISDEPRTIDPVTILPKKLTQKVTVEFKEWSLLEFAQWLEKTLEMPVILDKVSLEDAGISELELVTDNAEQEPAYLLLQRVLAPLPEPLTYYLDEEILYITTVTQAEEVQFTETYNLTEYLDAGYTSDALIEVITDSTSGPWFDIEGVGGTIQLLGDIMLVRSTQNIHLEIQATLKSLLKPGKQTFLLMPEKHLDYIDQLEQRVTVDYGNLPLVKVVAALSEQTKLPIRLDRITLEDAGISFRKPITLKLRNIKLRIILKALVTDEPTTWIVQDGVIYITTQTVAEEIVNTAVYDVRDLCRNAEESDALAQAQQSQTSGPWFDVDGVGGSISFPKPGIMVIRQTMEGQQEILNLLTIYRQSLLSAKPRKKKQEEDPNKIITHYYKMNAEMADSLVNVIPILVDLQTWKKFDIKQQGEIYLVRSKPTLIKLGSQSKVNKTTGKVDQVLESPQAVLLIKQTKANHELISKIIARVETGDTPFGAQQGGQSGGYGGKGGQGGGFGGGFFSLPTK